MLMKDCDGFVCQCHYQGKAETSGIVYIYIALIVVSDCILLSEMYCWMASELYGGLCVLHFGNTDVFTKAEKLWLWKDTLGNKLIC